VKRAAQSPRESSEHEAAERAYLPRREARLAGRREPR
jgi:hypothetical protein